jgi:hypothetical protein
LNQSTKTIQSSTTTKRTVNKKTHTNNNHTQATKQLNI